MKPTKYEKYDMLLVEWIDIVADTRWRSKEEAAVSKPSRIKTVGFFLSNFIMDKKWILKVSSSVAEDGQSDTIDIPFGVVTCITKLSVLEIQ